MSQLGMIGLGRMGANMVRRLLKAGHECAAHDRSKEAVAALAKEGAAGATTLVELVQALRRPRFVWLMVPSGVVDSVLQELQPLLQRGDTVIDGGNSRYQDAIRRAEFLGAAGIHFVDVGTSGGVLGLERGYCLMAGGERTIIEALRPILDSLGAVANGKAGWLHCGGHGAGHFVKMVHNGIEYGLMAAYAEGLNVLKHADAGLHRRAADAETAPLSEPQNFQYQFDLAAIAELWRHGSIIASSLLDVTAAALARSPTLENFSGHVSDSGEGRWTLQAAIEEGVPAYVLSAALYSRFSSRGQEGFANKLLSAMRLGFGGHKEQG